jgi:hypothetical protein
VQAEPTSPLGKAVLEAARFLAASRRAVPLVTARVKPDVAARPGAQYTPTHTSGSLKVRIKEPFDVPEVFVWVEGEAGGGAISTGKNYFKMSLKKICDAQMDLLPPTP